MALVKGNVLGNLSGRLGNLSARTIDGRTILGARPESFNASQGAASIAVRNRFAVTANFVRNLISLPALYEIWKKVKTSGISVYNFSFKTNFSYSAVDKPTLQNIITPGGFPFPVDTAVLDADNLEVALLALDTVSIFSAAEVDLSVNALVSYMNPINPANPEFQVITLNKEIAAFDFTQPAAVNMALNVVQKQIAAKYQDSILYFAVASKNAEGKVIQYSATFTQST